MSKAPLLDIILPYVHLLFSLGTLCSEPLLLERVLRCLLMSHCVLDYIEKRVRYDDDVKIMSHTLTKLESR